jgi:hypothetical protein
MADGPTPRPRDRTLRHTIQHNGCVPELKQQRGKSGTDQRNGVRFDPQDGSAVGGWTGCDEIGAHTTDARHAANCAE